MEGAPGGGRHKEGRALDGNTDSESERDKGSRGPSPVSKATARSMRLGWGSIDPAWVDGLIEGSWSSTALQP